MRAAFHYALLVHVFNVSWILYPLFALTIAIVLVKPRVTEAIPAPLVAVVVVTAIVMTCHLDVPNVGGNGTMAPGMPGITQFVVPLNLETLLIILNGRCAGLIETKYREHGATVTFTGLSTGAAPRFING